MLSSPRLLTTHPPTKPPTQPPCTYICHHPPKLPFTATHNHGTTETPHDFGKSSITVATAMVASSGLRAAESPPPPPPSIHQHVPCRGTQPHCHATSPASRTACCRSSTFHEAPVTNTTPFVLLWPSISQNSPSILPHIPHHPPLSNHHSPTIRKRPPPLPSVAAGATRLLFLMHLLLLHHSTTNGHQSCINNGGHGPALECCYLPCCSSL